MKINLNTVDNTFVLEKYTIKPFLLSSLLLPRIFLRLVYSYSSLRFQNHTDIANTFDACTFSQFTAHFFIHVCTIFRWISSKYCKQTFVLGVYLYEKTYKENDRKNFYCNFRFVCVCVRFHFFLNFFSPFFHLKEKIFLSQPNTLQQSFYTSYEEIFV